MTHRARPFRIATAFFAVLVAEVWLRLLFPTDETRYLAVAWEMSLSGDYFVLTKNFELYSHKPPLLFWLINLTWLVTGVSEGAARLVGPVCAGSPFGSHPGWPGGLACRLRHRTTGQLGLCGYANVCGFLRSDHV